MRFDEEVYQIVRKVPAGKVSTYGRIAAMAGRPGAARAVGNAMHRNPYEGDVPCHRVVNAKGGLAKNFAFDGSMEQKVRLEMEGVEVSGDFRVDLGKYLWRGDD